MAALAVPVIEAGGFEADDVIATLATEAAERQNEVVIVTGDRDSFQLITDPYVRVLYNKRGVSDYSLYDEAGILERTGVPPRSTCCSPRSRRPVRQPAGRARGGGEDRRQAAQQVRRPRRGLRAPRRADTQAPGEPGGERGTGPVNARIIPLVRDVPLDVDVDHLTLGGWDRATAEATFERYEMKTVWQRMEELLDAGALGEPAAGARAGSPRRPIAWRSARPGQRPARRQPPHPPSSYATSRCRRPRRRSRSNWPSSVPAGSRWRPVGTACPGAATWSRSSSWRRRATRRDSACSYQETGSAPPRSPRSSTTS